MNEQRVVCGVDCIIQLLGKICRQPNCQASISYKKNNVGCTLNIQWKCLQGHSGKWSSSKRCYSRNGYPFFVNNVLMASSILLSGNNFSKIALFCTSFNLQHIKTTTFYQVQRHYLCPTIESYWNEQKGKILSAIGDKPLVVSGDGRNDSPEVARDVQTRTTHTHVLDYLTA